MMMRSKTTILTRILTRFSIYSCLLVRTRVVDYLLSEKHRGYYTWIKSSLKLFLNCLDIFIDIRRGMTDVCRRSHGTLRLWRLTPESQSVAKILIAWRRTHHPPQTQKSSGIKNALLNIYQSIKSAFFCSYPSCLFYSMSIESLPKPQDPKLSSNIINIHPSHSHPPTRTSPQYPPAYPSFPSYSPPKCPPLSNSSPRKSAKQSSPTSSPTSPYSNTPPASSTAPFPPMETGTLISGNAARSRTDEMGATLI